MKRIFFPVLLIAAGSAISGCAVQSDLQHALSATAELVSGKVFTSPVTINYAFPNTALDVTVSPIGMNGIACSFPATISDAFYSTFDSVDRQAFRNIVAQGTPQSYRVRFELSSFDHSAIFVSRFFGSIVQARVEFTVLVTVMDPNSNEIARQMIRGEGQDQEDVGSCLAGAPTISAAVQKALRVLANEYTDRVLNTLTIN